MSASLVVRKCHDEPFRTDISYLERSINIDGELKIAIANVADVIYS